MWDNFLTSNIVETEDSITLTRSLKNFNPTNLASVLTVSSTASFNVNSVDRNYSKVITRNNTTLVQSKSMLLFSFTFFDPAFSNWFLAKDNSIGIILNRLFLFLGQRSIVSDVQMSLLNGLFSTSLPHMGAKNISASSKYNVSSSVMIP